MYCYCLFLAHTALTEVVFFLCRYTTKIHTTTVMVLTTTSISKVCALVTTVGVLKYNTGITSTGITYMLTPEKLVAWNYVNT